MKIALFIENDFEQIVLTPETSREVRILEGLHEKRTVSVKRGGFYHCQGGWLRQSQDPIGDSTMLVLSADAPDGEGAA